MEVKTVPVFTELEKKMYEVGLISRDYEIQKFGNKTQRVPIYDERLLNYLAGSIQENVRKEFDVPILITGQRRKGKSTVSQKIARIIDNGFKVQQIAFRLEQFNKNLHDMQYANPGDNWYPQIIQDESGYDLLAANWMKALQKNLVRKLEVIGAKNFITYWNLPHRKLLNKSLREGFMRWWIHVKTIDGLRGFAELREGVENIWDMDMFWNPVCAFTFSLSDDDLWHQYSLEKEKFIDEVTSDEGDENGEDTKLQSRTKQRNALIKLAISKGITQREIQTVTGLDQSVISRIHNNGLN